MGELCGSNRRIFHENLVFQRRTKVLANHISDLIPHGSRVLDVGCGDGTIDMLISRQRPDITVTGLDVLVRPDAKSRLRSSTASIFLTLTRASMS